MSGGAGWEWRQREYDQIPLERLRTTPPAPPPGARMPEPVDDAGCDEPDPPLDARWVEHQAHVFHAPASNATREKKYDAFGRWYWADGKVY